MAEIYYQWHPIEDLPDDFMSLANQEFHEIAEIWLEVKAKIKGLVFNEFLERLNREWAIELGQVENLYFFTENITKTLIEHGLQSIELPHQNGGFDIVDPALFLQSHSDIINGLYEDVKQGMQINKWMIRGMHSALTEFQDFAPGIDLSGRRKRIPLRKGQFKIWPNNPTRSDGLLHQYCPPDQVESEIDNLMRMHKEHNAKNVPIDVEAAWFHHRFVQIHPFQDGNGRMARALASLIFIERGYLPPVVTNIGKPAYIDALDAANTGNLKPFVDYLALLVVNKTRQCIRLYQDAKDELAGNPTKPGSPKPR